MDYMELFKKYVEIAKTATEGEMDMPFVWGTLRPSEIHMISGHFNRAVAQLKVDVVIEDYSQKSYIHYFMVNIDGNPVKVFALFSKEGE